MITAVWDITLCNPVQVYRRLRGAWRLWRSYAHLKRRSTSKKLPSAIYPKRLSLYIDWIAIRKHTDTYYFNGICRYKNNKP